MTTPADSTDAPCAAALSQETDTSAAVAEVSRQVLDQLGGPADLVVVFWSRDHDGELVRSELARHELGGYLLGCSGESIVGVRREVEQQSAISLWAARLPGTTVVPLRLAHERGPEGGAFAGWPADLLANWPAGASIILLADPMSFPADQLMHLLGEEHPEVPVFGGMASGMGGPHRATLLDSERSWDEGAVGVLLHGDVRLTGIVSQGCRPVGKPFVVTKADRNVIQELGGEPALLRFKEVFEELPVPDQELIRQGLHVGRVVDEYRDEFRRGDFLIRNVMGADRNSGAIVLGDYVRAGQTVQFHVRDAAAADEDLRELLQRYREQSDRTPLGGLLFTCNGRGTRLFPEPHHDAAAVADVLDEIPLAGLFAAGEFGPIANRNFLHGFTASLAVFEA